MAIMIAPPAVSSAAAPACAADARVQALKLLRFHVDGDERAAIEPGGPRKVGTIAPLGGGKHRFDVLELWGDVYKGSYRIRLIYADVAGECVLMGQEIYERSDL
jgi:hypothetical protein